MRTKPAIKSLTIWGGVTSLYGLFELFREVINSNPGLIEDSRVALIALAVALGNVITILGRWKAKYPIEGLVRERRK